MNDAEKRRQLKKYKSIATGLFVLMALVFVATSLLLKNNGASWLGFVRAFSEAAMVGALADWFAVTALFHHPMGIKIPHTNLIQNKKEQIGDNLGSFVVSNFLSPQNIRPYIQKIKVSHFAGDWLSKEKNQNMLMHEVSNILLDIIQKLDDDTVIKFTAAKAKEMSANLKFNEIIGNGLDYLLDRNDHQRLITNLAGQIKTYITNNRVMVRDRVKKESFVLIPKFVDDAIADKITSGLSTYFEEVETNTDHDLRTEITAKLLGFAEELKTEEKWQDEFSTVRDSFLKEEKLRGYSEDIWKSVKKTVVSELEEENSLLKRYIAKNINSFSENLQTDEELQYKIDHWIRVTAYKYILKNTHQFGDLISSTVGNWEGRELSDKLELEVGKDLQFIRVNGTLVGGLVGLIIYTVSHYLL